MMKDNIIKITPFLNDSANNDSANDKKLIKEQSITAFEKWVDEVIINAETNNASQIMLN